MPEERFTVGRMFRAYLAAAEKLGLREAIARSSPELAHLFEKPPIVTARIPGSLCDKLYEEVERARGREAVRGLGYEAMRSEGVKLIGSLVENSFGLYGRTPEAVFSNIALVMGPVVGNTSVTWKSTGPSSGTVEIRPQGHPGPLGYAMWEGYFLYFFEASGTQGTVAEARLADDQQSAAIDVQW